LGTTDRHLAVADTCMHIKNTNTPEIETREREREKSARERWFVRSFRSAPRLQYFGARRGATGPRRAVEKMF
jgi:hypothetical protein